MELLKEIYKFDLKILLKKLTIDNFCEYFQIVDEIVKSESVEFKIQQEVSDTILIFCLNRLFSQTDSSNQELSSTSTVILQYVQLCSHCASKNVQSFLVKYYIYNFIRCILSSNSNLSLNTTKLCDGINGKLFEKRDEKDKILLQNEFSFNLKQINLLNNYYNIIIQSLISKINSDSNENDSSSEFIINENKELLERLIEITLKFLHEIDNTNVNLIRLCVHTIEKLIKLNSYFKNFILSKCLEILKYSYNSLSSLVLDKKRLESHCEDLNMYLLTALADYIIVNESRNDYLNGHQFWYLLQASLAHTNTLTRKRGLYLLKRTIDFSLTNNIRVTCDDDCSINNNYCYLFDSNLTVWNDFFLCIELFEETSIHVIKPCLSKVDNILAEVNQGKLHLSWLLVLLQRALTHESKYMVRWSLAYFYRGNFFSLMENKFYESTSLLQMLNRFIMGPLFVALQEAFLYYKVDDMPYVNNCPILALYLSDFLNSYIDFLPNQDQKSDFIYKFTSSITNYAWSAPCLLFITRAIYELKEKPTTKLMSPAIIRNLNKIITMSMATHEVLLRSSSQTFLISAALKHVKPSELDELILREIIDLLNVLSNKECLVYLNSTWNLTVNWLKCACASSNEGDSTNDRFLAKFIENEFESYYNSNDLNEFLVKNNSSKLSKLILMLSDVDDKILNKITIQLNDRLFSANKYIYMPSQKVDKCLIILNNLLKLVKSSKFCLKTSKSYQYVKQLHNNTIAEVLMFLLRKATDASDQALNFLSVSIYSQLLENLLASTVETPTHLSADVSRKLANEYLAIIIATVCEQDKLATNKFSLIWKKYIIIYYFSILCHSSYSTVIVEQLSTLNNSEFLQHLLNFQIPTKMVLSNSEKDLSKELIDNLNENYSVFNGKYSENLWKIYDFYLKNFNLLLGKGNLNSTSNTLDTLVTKYEDSLDLISPHSLSLIIKSSSNFIGMFKSVNNESFIERFLVVLKRLYEQIWSIYQDIRNFSHSFESFINILFSNEFFNFNHSANKVQQFIMDISIDILSRGNDRSGLVKPMLDKLLEALQVSPPNINKSFIKLFIDFVTFGTVYKKEKRHIKDIEVFVESLAASFGTNQLIKSDYLHDVSVRVSMIYYLMQEKSLNDDFYAEFIKLVIEKDKKCQSGNLKLYTNSLVHRERFRLWQSILIILPRLNQINIKPLLEYGDEILLIENQPSIRILMEWIFIKTNLQANFEGNDLWKKLDNSSSKKVGYICSWISIMSQLTPFVKEEKLVLYFKNLVSLVLSQVLSPNFHIRTYAEATLLKLYLASSDTKNKNQLNTESFKQHAEIKPLLNVIFSIVKDIIDDKERYSTLIMNHFYFQFNPQEDYSINTILFWLPYLCGIIDDELVDSDLFRAIALKKQVYEVNRDDVCSFKSLVKLTSNDEHFHKCQVGIWKFTAYKDEHSFEPAVSIEDLQKKITPWHTLIPKQQDFETIIKSRKINPYDNTNPFGLILVATLIDKGPNLGGLCRTSEIFNVKEFVIANMRYAEDKQFQSLSVTAEKWLNIKEVPLKYLKTYLVQMKLMGYTLVGVEQTANSEKLNKYKFPKKTLLLLGNEKEGIPVELIQILDVCVEIPQLGIIRSLNVHVSAALVIWEYTKQILDHI